ncbi:unnamed protein product [Periconia digitata]|uniref:Carbohydrate kinase PfkB domain-containing protein n=1 Tax=Periconia digitata TaxID=1303443 RepID=A0A9W4URQ1_9PLEO|nr:unnamed protein product [Periconia digitata]
MSPNISCVSLGMVIIDDIHMPGRPPLKDVLGGSASFVTLGQRLFASTPPEVGCLVIAGNDFPSNVKRTFDEWGITLVTKVRTDRKSSRGKLVYQDTTFGRMTDTLLICKLIANRHTAKTFEYNGEPLRATPDDLVGTPLLHAKAIHLFGSPKEIVVQVPQLLKLRNDQGISERPLIVWEPLPAACTKANREAILAACQVVDVFSPNHLEIAAVFEDAPLPDFDTERWENFGQSILDSSLGPSGAGVVVIRAGENGAVAMSQTMRPIWLPSYYEQGSSKVIDPTGAGNTFLGGYIAGWQHTGDICEAMKFGHVAASFAVEQIGLPKLGSVAGRQLCEQWCERCSSITRLQGASPLPCRDFSNMHLEHIDLPSFWNGIEQLYGKKHDVVIRQSGPSNSGNKLKRARDDSWAVEEKQLKRTRLQSQIISAAPVVKIDGNRGPRTSTRKSVKRSRDDSDIPSTTQHKKLRIESSLQKPQEAVFNPLCGNSDGKNSCNCRKKRRKRTTHTCMFKGRSVTPLAFDLKLASAHPQSQCPLFSKLPRHLRSKIYEFALLNYVSGPDRGGNWPDSTIAWPLLLTCKSIYLRAYKIPYLINYFQFDGPNRPSFDFSLLAPWQFALIQNVGCSIVQDSSEPYLRDIIRMWKPESRHDSSFVVPRFFQAESVVPEPHIKSFNFALMSAYRPKIEPLRDGMLVEYISDQWSRERKRFDVGVMLARQLTHLTLRLRYDDWSTSMCHPNSRKRDEQLSYDPALCYDKTEECMEEIGTASDMFSLYLERKAGKNPPATDGSLCAIVNTIPSLKTMDIALETYEPKRGQLDRVVDCAKLWTFPRLVWNGKVTEEEWSTGDDTSDTNGDTQMQDGTQETQEAETGDWRDACTRFVVRTLHYRRRASDETLNGIINGLEDTSLMEVDNDGSADDFIVDHGREGDH